MSSAFLNSSLGYWVVILAIMAVPTFFFGSILVESLNDITITTGNFRFIAGFCIGFMILINGCTFHYRDVIMGEIRYRATIEADVLTVCQDTLLDGGDCRVYTQWVMANYVVPMTNCANNTRASYQSGKVRYTETTYSALKSCLIDAHISPTDWMESQ